MGASETDLLDGIFPEMSACLRDKRETYSTSQHHSPKSTEKMYENNTSVMSDDSDKNLKQRISNKVRVNDTFDFFKFKIISVLTKKKKI